MKAFHQLELIPIVLEFKCNSQFVEILKEHSAPTSMSNLSGVHLLNSYFNQGYEGTMREMYCRNAIARQLAQARDLLGHGFCFEIFDAFRTRETQSSLFKAIFDRITNEEPHLSAAEVLQKTRTFVAHPEEKSRFAVPPHNSGGAIDLTLSYNGKSLDMGTEFDETNDLARTLFFEAEHDSRFGISEQRWFKVRCNRRILFNAMKLSGFVNYQSEWWHYDLGDCIWADAVKATWFYESMEEEVVSLCAESTV